MDSTIDGKEKWLSAKQEPAVRGSSKLVTRDMLASHFHLPINDVADKLGLCVTALKQRCREYGIKRWPYRKVRKLDTMLQSLEQHSCKWMDAPQGSPVVGHGFSVAKRKLEEDAFPSEDIVDQATKLQILQQISLIKKARVDLLSNPNSKVHLKATASLASLPPLRSEMSNSNEQRLAQADPLSNWEGEGAARIANANMEVGCHNTTTGSVFSSVIVADSLVKLEAVASRVPSHRNGDASHSPTLIPPSFQSYILPQSQEGCTSPRLQGYTVPGAPLPFVKTASPIMLQPSTPQPLRQKCQVAAQASLQQIVQVQPQLAQQQQQGGCAQQRGQHLPNTTPLSYVIVSLAPTEAFPAPCNLVGQGRSPGTVKGDRQIEEDGTRLEVDFLSRFGKPKGGAARANTLDPLSLTL